MREKLIALSIIKEGKWDDVYHVLLHDKQLNYIDERDAHELLQRLNCDVLTLLDLNYPQSWLEMSKPPFVVFYKGDVKLLKSKAISVIGGKEVSVHTAKMVRRLMRDVSGDSVVANGFEIGVEMYNMKHASQRIAFIASGFEADGPYQRYGFLKKMNQHDLILSELPPNTKFDIAAYYRSYHLIHELSDIVCVFELAGFDLRLKYLAYLTDIGKEVVVMSDVLNRSTSGGLGLVNRGAKLLLHTKDISSVFD